MKKALRLTVCAFLSWTLQSDFAWSAFVVDSASVIPATAPVGVATTLTITARISDPTVLPDGVNLQRLDAAGRVVSVIGLLRDDGANGDAVAGDGVFTIRSAIFEQVAGPVRFRVSAAFRGRPLRAMSSPLTVNVTGGTGITILAPANLALVSVSPITVSGTVGDPAATVTVNGTPASVFGGQFLASVPLVEGTNTLTAVAVNTGGGTSTAAVQVTLDTTPPQLTVGTPADNFITTSSSITVAGSVTDVLQTLVTVNGLPAVVTNGNFSAVVPLALGLNIIQVTARDALGNSVSTSVHVTRNPVVPPFIRVVSGNNQSGPVSSVLPAPLVVALDDGAGGAVANTLVIFRVTDNNGVLTGGGVTASTVGVTTNASGQAQVMFQLGSRAGTAGNRVEATATGFTGTAVLSASGLSATVFHVIPFVGNLAGTVGRTLTDPLGAIVLDAGNNRLSGVPVTFTVTQGGGSINSSTTFTTNTDPDGMVQAFLTLGPQPGLYNNIVELMFHGTNPLVYSVAASGAAPGNADTDGDGISDIEEITPGADGFITSPVLADSDGDGVRDALEIASGSDPTNPASLNLGMALQSLQVDPANFSITINSVQGIASKQLTVTGQLLDGTSIDLTSTLRGTSYASNNLSACNPAPDGRVSATDPGSCLITILNNGFLAVATGTVTTFSPSFLSSVAIPGYANNVDVSGGFAYVAAGSAGLQVVSVANPNAPVIVAALDTPGNANDVRVVGSRAYIADGSSGLQIVDVSVPQAPTLLGALDTTGEANDVIVSGNFAYVADGISGLQIIDVSNPAAPTLVGTVDTPGTARGVDVEGSIAVVADDSPAFALRVIDVSNPAAAAIVGSVSLNGEPKDVDLADGFAYVAAFTGGVHVVDVQVPTVPLLIGGLPGVAPNGFVPRDVKVVGQFALFAEQLFAAATAPIVDISTPAAPVVRGLLNFVLDYAGTGIAVNGPYVYWTGQSFVVTSENGSLGTTRLFIGQYLSQ